MPQAPEVLAPVPKPHSPLKHHDPKPASPLKQYDDGDEFVQNKGDKQALQDVMDQIGNLDAQCREIANEEISAQIKKFDEKLTYWKDQVFEEMKIGVALQNRSMSD